VAHARVSSRFDERLQYDPLDLIERIAPVVQFGGASAVVRRHLLSRFQQAAIEKIDRDARTRLRRCADWSPI
jgi:hypothetical protein